MIMPTSPRSPARRSSWNISASRPGRRARAQRRCRNEGYSGAAGTPASRAAVNAPRFQWRRGGFAHRKPSNAMATCLHPWSLLMGEECRICCSTARYRRRRARVAAAALAPSAVIPSRQNQRHWLETGAPTELREMNSAGQAAIIVLGHIGFYSRFGFRHDLAANLTCDYNAV